LFSLEPPASQIARDAKKLTSKSAAHCPASAVSANTRPGETPSMRLVVPVDWTESALQ
jgi:hypothetical protein